jgi:hypothetical protein
MEPKKQGCQRMQQLAGLLKEAIGTYPKVIKGTYTVYKAPGNNQDYYIKFGNEEVDTKMIGGVFDGKFKWIGSSGCDCGDFFSAIVDDINNSGTSIR